MSAYTIFLFQKSNRRFGGRHAFKEFIYAELALEKAAAVTAKLVVYIGLRYRKSGQLLCFRFFYVLQLFLKCREQVFGCYA